MKIIQHNDNGYFIIGDVICTADQWISAAGVKSESPGADIALRIYNCYFRGVKNVANEYNKYYRKEFLDLWDYLYWHRNCSKDVILEIKKEYAAGMFILYGQIHAGGDCCLDDYAASEDDGFPLVKQLIEKLPKGSTE